MENFNSRIDQAEHRILELEDQVEELQHSDNIKIIKYELITFDMLSLIEITNLGVVSLQKKF